MDDASFDALLKVRCRQDLIDRLDAIARIERRTFPDFIRLVLDDYCSAQEKVLRLGEHSPAVTKHPNENPKPVNYKGKRSKDPPKQKAS